MMMSRSDLSVKFGSVKCQMMSSVSSGERRRVLAACLGLIEAGGYQEHEQRSTNQKTMTNIR